MIEIKELLNRFNKIIISGEERKKAIATAISGVINVEIKPKQIEIKNNTIYLNIKPLYKNEIFLKKNEIFLKLKDFYKGKTPPQIR